MEPSLETDIYDRVHQGYADTIIVPPVILNLHDHSPSVQAAHAEGVRMAYQWMHHFITVIVIAVLVYFTFFYLIVSYFKTMSAMDAVAESTLALIATVGVCALLWAVRRIAFPRVVFELGVEKQRNEVRRFWRRWAITGLVFAIPIGLIVRAIGAGLKL